MGLDVYLFRVNDTYPEYNRTVHRLERYRHQPRVVLAQQNCPTVCFGSGLNTGKTHHLPRCPGAWYIGRLLLKRVQASS